MNLIPNIKWPVTSSTDRRLFANKEQLAGSKTAWITVHFADLKSKNNANAGLDCQLLFGEEVKVLETQADWVKVRREFDGYIGWIADNAISFDVTTPTHQVIAPRTFVYSAPDLKLPRTGYRSMGSKIAVTEFVENRGTRYAMLESGEAIIASHIVSLDEYADDYVSVAEKMLHTPYLWGGNTAFGIDCSGLVQLSMAMAGKQVLRDTDMQASTIGQPVMVAPDYQDLQRGDLVYWRGHVAIAQGILNGEAYLIHANGNSMDVTSEPAKEAIDRTEYLYELPIGVRRPD
jgi:cell wall-associated NlpC family hydrolase